MTDRLTMTREELAEELQMSLATLSRRRLAGMILDPIACSSAEHPRWSSEEVRAWVRAGSPDAASWRRRREPTQAR